METLHICAFDDVFPGFQGAACPLGRRHHFTSITALTIAHVHARSENGIEMQMRKERGVATSS
jgi:hypothetical protein